MRVRIARVEFARIAPLKEKATAAVECQLVRDSILPRGLATAFSISREGELVGYAGVWKDHFPNRLLEFWIAEPERRNAGVLFRETIRVTGATTFEAQTNVPFQHGVVLEHCSSIRTENLLFEDSGTAPLDVEIELTSVGPGATEYVAHLGGHEVGRCGILHHYNAPFVDVYMEVAEEMRMRGIGTSMVSRLRMECGRRGWIAAARCDPLNEASRRTLLRGGMKEVGALVVGDVRQAGPV